MITVADTSPLRCLILVEAIDVLPRIFGQVYAPPEVMQERGASRSPGLEAVRRWAASPPAWLTVQGPRELDPSIQLDTGADTKTIVNVPCSVVALVPAGSRTKTTVPVP